MALRRFCDMCGIQVVNGRYLTLELKSGSGRRDIANELSEKDVCEDCAKKVRTLVTGWVEVSLDG